MRLKVVLLQSLYEWQASGACFRVQKCQNLKPRLSNTELLDSEFLVSEPVLRDRPSNSESKLPWVNLLQEDLKALSTEHIILCTMATDENKLQPSYLSSTKLEILMITCAEKHLFKKKAILWEQQKSSCGRKLLIDAHRWSTHTLYLNTNTTLVLYLHLCWENVIIMKIGHFWLLLLLLNLPVSN